MVNKKLILILVIFSRYIHGADQDDLGRRASFSKRSYGKMTTSHVENEFSQPKRVKKYTSDDDVKVALEGLQEKLREKKISIAEIENIQGQIAGMTINSYKLTNLYNDTSAMLQWQKKCRKYPCSFFSNPKDTSETKLSTYLTGIIHHSKHDIKIACFHITSYPVAQALVARKNAGVRVQVLTNKKQGGSTNALNLMQRENIDMFVPKEVQGKPFLSLHAKFFLFKNVLGEQITITGSNNPTDNADNNEWNDLLILNDDKMFEQYTQQFEVIKKECEKANCFTR